ncbi:MAG: anhydro-N-acetylmuramic acid kinase [Deltaproteobacteria bacterium]|nr:anhydro-N-acetylmuramic acid kinase [Deltaproteobacteria bacterium]
MSGTSKDSITVAICEINPQKVSLLGFNEIEYSQQTLKKLRNCLTLKTPELSELNFIVGLESADAVLQTQEKLGLKCELVGFHGQTVYHHSGLTEIKSTLQIGIGEWIAEKVGCPVVSDFRYRDIVCGGGGAPLSPWGDLRLFNFQYPFAVLNIGGVANYTFIDRKNEIILGFDCGPGNALLDRFVRKMNLNERGFDVRGDLGRKGNVDHNLHQYLLSRDNYFDLEPPKSCGFERFGDKFLEDVIQYFPHVDAFSFLRTLYEFTVDGIISGLKFMPNFEKLIIVGGGAYNEFLVNLIRHRLGERVTIVLSDEVGIPVKAREAMIFACLAYDLLSGKHTNITTVTGAKKTCFQGRLIFP